jgi:Arc/MetJ-type ribon-helix-helix transcriptional regulator
MLSKEKSISKSIATKLPQIELEEINRLVDAGVFLSGSDFVREAIRDKLRSIKIIKIRDLDYDTAKKEVLGYYREYNKAFMSDVADDLELDLELVVNINDKKKKEGRIKPVEKLKKRG